jgi:hypothetical protein
MKKLYSLIVLVLLPACGGGGSSPTTVTPPTAVATTTTTTTTLAPQTIVENLGGSISAGDPTCSSPFDIHDNKPCQRYRFTPTNAGAMQATLTWSNRSTDLDLELWRGSTKLISTLSVGTTEEISSNVTPGAYELRVIYYRGETTQPYDLRLAHPN